MRDTARIFLILSVVFILSLSIAGCGNEDEFLPEASSDFVYTTTENEHDNPMNEDNIIPHEQAGYCGNTITTVSYRYSYYTCVNRRLDKFVYGQ